jgi:hypothetical protein
VEKIDQESLIPSVSKVRARLTRNIEETKLLRRQLRISEDAAAEEYARRAQSREISRFRREKEQP